MTPPDARGTPAGELDRRLGARLRHVRRQQRLSLHDVEVASEGDFKASVLSAYERGERTLTLSRLRRLAEFYRVPVAELLPVEEVPTSDEPAVVVDLVALERARDQAPTLARYVDGVRRRRGDHNARVLTLRGQDLWTLAAARGVSPERLREELIDAGVLRSGA